MKSVLCHGVFDLFHFGHLEHLRQARAFGNVLVVSVVPDAHTPKNPVWPERERLAILRACKYVDLAILCDGPGPEKLLYSLRPSVYVRSEEYAAQDKPEYPLVRELGIEVAFTRSVPPHTSDLIRQIKARP